VIYTAPIIYGIHHIIIIMNLNDASGEGRASKICLEPMELPVTSFERSNNNVKIKGNKTRKESKANYSSEK